MLQLPEAQLVETLLHELVHATAFVASDADFNEGVASFVGEEARVRFYQQREGSAAARAQRRQVTERRQVRHELLRLRTDVRKLYEMQEAGPERDRMRAELEQRTRVAIGSQALSDADPEVLAGRLRLNDACLALVATYAADTACYDAALATLDGDLRHFVARLRDAESEADPRTALLGGASCPGPP
jgi:predicted aminopeptidase